MSSIRTRFLALCVVVIATMTVFLPRAAAQTVTPTDTQVDTGVKGYKTYDGTRENINLSSGNLNLSIPLLHLPGRAGRDLDLSMRYNSQFWAPQGGFGSLSYAAEVNPLGPQTPGWQYWVPAPFVHPSGVDLFGPTDWNIVPGHCLNGFVGAMPDGGKYSFPSIRWDCTDAYFYYDPPPQPYNAQGVSGDSDGSGIVLDLWNGKMKFRDGTYYSVSSNSSAYANVDTNGNEINLDATSGVVKDTLGRIITMNRSNPAQTTIAYPDFNNPTQVQTITIQQQSLNVTCLESMTITVPTAVILPNGTTYTFQYTECGELSKITYPSGGYTRYQYGGFPKYWTTDANQRKLTVTVREVTAKYVCRAPAISLGATSAAAGNNCPVAEDVTTYKPTIDGTMYNNSQMEVEDAATRTVYQFSQYDPHADYPKNAVEIRRDIYDVAGATPVHLKKVQTAYTDTVPLFPKSQTTTLCTIPSDSECADGFVSKVEWDYDTLAVQGWAVTKDNVLEQREYDYGQGSPGPLLRKTKYSWLHKEKPEYAAANILDRKTSETVYDGADHPAAKTIYEYDNYTDSPMLSSGAVQNILGTGYTVRGNVTAIKRWRGDIPNGVCPDPTDMSPQCWAITRHQYDNAGNVVKTTDPNGNSTYFSYSDDFADGVNRNTAAYVTQTTLPTTTNGVAHIERRQYQFGSGLVAASCGQNYPAASTCSTGGVNVPDYVTYSYDMLGRETRVATGDGGLMTTSFNESSYPLSATTTQLINSSGTKKVTTALIDGLARVYQTQLNSDPSCSAGVKVDIAYDRAERKASVSNPYCSTNDETYGITTYTYDGLNRTTKVTHPDATTSETTFVGRAVLTKDEGNGTVRVQKISQSDALGRLRYVCEVSATAQAGVSPSACGLDIGGSGFLTTYSYDALGNVTSVLQGAIHRTFAHNSLSQLITAVNPESGTTCYGAWSGSNCVNGYDADGNLLRKTANNITTTYSYDALNRLTGKTYSDQTTPSACFQYDSAPESTAYSPQVSYNVGRLTNEWTQMGSCPATMPSTGKLTQRVLSYEVGGRIKNDRQCPTNIGCHQFVTYDYDLAGNVTSLQPGIRSSVQETITSSYNSANRLGTVTNRGMTLFSGSYAPFGGLWYASIGSGITMSRRYDRRLRPVSETDSALNVPRTVLQPQYVLLNGNIQTSGGARSTGSFTFSGAEKMVTTQGQTTYDTGAFLFSINGTQPVIVSYGQGDTPSTLAARTAAAFNGFYGFVTATASGPTVVLTSAQEGSQTNYSIQGWLAGNNTTYFPQPSFAVTASGSTMTGGRDAGGITDSGTVTLRVDGTTIASVNYAAGSTATSVIDSLVTASAGSSRVQVTRTSAQLVLAALQPGNHNYSIGITYNSVFPQASFWVSPATGTLAGPQTTYDWGTIYSYSVQYTPNGNVKSYVDSVNGSWNFSQSGDYDDMNRLMRGTSTAGICAGVSIAWSYDRYGNRLSQTGSGSASSPKCNMVQPQSYTFLGNNNRIDGWSYDGAGNLLNDGHHTYTYDAENRIISVDGAGGYIYDAEGRRLAKTRLTGSNPPTILVSYVLGLGGEQVMEDLPGDGTAPDRYSHINVFAGGRLLATYDASQKYHYDLTDWLGSRRLTTAPNGDTELSCISYPFGDSLRCWNPQGTEVVAGSANDSTEHHFTGKERDAETGLDYFGARYLSSDMGRFTSVDPIWITKERLLDPQRLNLYAYGLNNPLRFVDPDGMDVTLGTCSGATQQQCFEQLQAGLRKEDREHVHLVQGDGTNGFKKGEYGIAVDADYKSESKNFQTLQTLANDHSATARIDVLQENDTFQVKTMVGFDAKTGKDTLATRNMTPGQDGGFSGYTFYPYVKGVPGPYSTGNFTNVIANASRGDVSETIYHELRHVLLGDFGRKAPYGVHGTGSVDSQTTDAEKEASKNKGTK